MVFLHTSTNVKLLKNLIVEYEDTSEISPHEFMKAYIEKCPEDVDEDKLTWLAETFMSYYKHRDFFVQITTHLPGELSENEQEYFRIIFHAVAFFIDPEDQQQLYKCLFNLRKPLLNTFTKFLCNNEVLTLISQVAQNYYDTNYITERIIGPLFEWQPHISEMAREYAEQVAKSETKKSKQPTVPIQPNVLNRKGKATHTLPPLSKQSSAITSLQLANNVKKRVVTKEIIDKKLQEIHEKNKQKSLHLLNNVKSKNYHYAQAGKSENYIKTIDNIVKRKNENASFKPQTTSHEALSLKKPPKIKQTATTVKRLQNRIQTEEKEEVEWLQNVICYRNIAKFEELAEQERRDKEHERLLDIEKKHLMGLLSYEEAVLAKSKLRDENKRKYEEFLKEKQSWNEKLERWQKRELDKQRKSMEKQSLSELRALEAKNEIYSKKKEAVEAIRKETEMMIAKAMKAKQEELARKAKMIKEFKILEVIAKKAKLPKIIDLTQTPGFGFLCEMSIAELQERVSAMKMSLKDELELKRKRINDEKEAAKQELEETKKSIHSYLAEHAQIRKQNKSYQKRVTPTIDTTSLKKIEELKKDLEEKRRLRLKLTNP